MSMTIGNMVAIKAFTFGATKTWDAVASTTVEQTVTVPGLKVGDIVVVNKPTHQVGCVVGTSRVTAADTLGVTFVTTATVTPTASEVWKGVLFRPDYIDASATI
jgi:hypothetical protein